MRLERVPKFLYSRYSGPRTFEPHSLKRFGYRTVASCIFTLGSQDATRYLHDSESSAHKIDNRSFRKARANLTLSPVPYKPEPLIVGGPSISEEFAEAYNLEAVAPETRRPNVGCQSKHRG